MFLESFTDAVSIACNVFAGTRHKSAQMISEKGGGILCFNLI